MAPKLEWRLASGRHALGHECWAGRIKVGSAGWGMASRGDPLVWQAHTTLPGISLKEPTRFATVEEAKARVERAVAYWFAAASDVGSATLSERTK